MKQKKSLCGNLKRTQPSRYTNIPSNVFPTLSILLSELQICARALFAYAMNVRDYYAAGYGP